MLTSKERNYLKENMASLFEEYDYEYSTYAIDDIIDEWVSQKGWLIELFKKHPNYVEGKFMIAFDMDYERPMNSSALNGFAVWLLNYPVKTMVSDLPNEIKERMSGCKWLPSRLYNFLSELYLLKIRTIDDAIAEELNEIIPEIHAHTGQKTSRVINKICTYLGYNKHPDYNREFAKYADALNPLVIKRHTILSLNPLDYLTMSFGNSWASCHTIDKSNKRGMPNSYEGQYSSGTISYMLDPSSMVFYTVDKSYEGNEYWNQPKINRQMFHYGEEKLVQGRLYPQNNDICKDIYTSYRNIVQEVMSTILKVPNLWTLKVGTDAASEYIESYGTHYHDYQYYSNCSLSKLKATLNERNIQVGASPICIECGETHNKPESINCCNISNAYICEDCGCVIEEGEEIWVGDYMYCRDCVHWCDSCNEYFRGSSYLVHTNGNEYTVCEYCFNDYIWCDECSEYHYCEEVTYIESEGIDVCQSCLKDKFTRCADCGKWFRCSDMYEEDGKLYCEGCHKEEE